MKNYIYEQRRKQKEMEIKSEIEIYIKVNMPTHMRFKQISSVKRKELKKKREVGKKSAPIRS